MLIVDDNETNRQVIREQLTRWDMNCDVVASGPAALKMLREAQTKGDAFHIAILDYQMPGMDGVETARLIRNLAEARDVLLIMLSSGLSPNDDLEVRSIFSAFLMKPLRSSALFDTLVELWTKGPRLDHREKLMGLPEGESKSVEEPRGLVALLVEDNLTNQKVAASLLKKLGCSVMIASDGKQAVELSKDRAFDLERFLARDK